MFTLVSFQYLIDKLDHGWYTGRTLPRSFQDLLTVRTGRREALASAATLPPPKPQTIGRDGRAGDGGSGGGGGGGGVIVTRQRRQNDCDGEVIPNSRPIKRLRILSG